MRNHHYYTLICLGQCAHLGCHKISASLIPVYVVDHFGSLNQSFQSIHISKIHISKEHIVA